MLTSFSSARSARLAALALTVVLPPLALGPAAIAGVAFDASPRAIAFPGTDFGPLSPRARGSALSPKLSLDLQSLVTQYSGARGQAPYTADQLRTRFGISPQTTAPSVAVAVTLKPGASGAALRKDGATVFFRVGSLAYANAPVRLLERIAAEPSVLRITATAPASSPVPPPAVKGVLGRDQGALPISFDHQGLTGKGVVVGLVDSGIDWKHADFRRADGSTRILALWDMTDDSYTTSHGQIGSAPPFSIQGQPIGTVYTQAQIDAALRGQGTVASGDMEGHGTASAGTAAANGLAPGHFAGVAPDADLVIVRAGVDSHVTSGYVLGTYWIVKTAQARHEPCVVNHSFGTQIGPHDGATPEAKIMNGLAGPGKPGVVLCASAGNEGRENLHASGRFGPKTAGQQDIESEPIDLFVTQPTELDGYFRHDDGWALAVVDLGGRVTGADGKPAPFALTPKDGDVGLAGPEGLDRDAVKAVVTKAQLEMGASGHDDRLAVSLAPGHYQLFGVGITDQVATGAFDLYLPFSQDAAFGEGTDKRAMVAVPADADSVIAFGAYNVRRSWTNADGKPTAWNLTLGDLAVFSSPGYRRGGMVKPEVCAPGAFLISPLAAGSAMGKTASGDPDRQSITPDGRHLAWQGTSASSPYAAGVIALMLQKDPHLDAASVRAILIRTATQDAFTGAVPNPGWGYGKLNPAAALRATPRLGGRLAKK